MKNHLIRSLSTITSLGLLLFSTAASAATCGSVQMTATSPNPSGDITCQAYGPNNIVLNGGGYNVIGGITSGSLPAYTTILAENNGTGASGGFNFSNGLFSIDSNIWDLWDSVFIGIKNGNSNSGGGWGLFEVEEIVNEGNYITRLNAQNGGVLSISHYFAVGGTPDNTTVIPIPAAVWFFGTGILAMMGIALKNKHANVA